MTQRTLLILALLGIFLWGDAKACCGIGVPDFGIKSEVLVGIILFLIGLVALVINAICIKIYKKLIATNRYSGAKAFGIMTLILNFVLLFPFGVLVVVWLCYRYGGLSANKES